MVQMTRIRLLIVQLTFGVTFSKDNGHLRGGSVDWHIGRGEAFHINVCLLAVKHVQVTSTQKHLMSRVLVL